MDAAGITLLKTSSVRHINKGRQGAAGQLLASPRAVAAKAARARRMQAVQSNTAAAAVATATAAFVFTPYESLLGGLTLGVLASAKLGITGRILGISGIVRGIVRGSAQAWRVAFVAGLVAGGFALQLLLPGAFEALPATYTLQRAAAAGLLVGVGTALGSGCTSGHGICGNSRLSVRSLVATMTFMLAGIVAAYLSGTAAVFGLPAGIAPLAAAASAPGVRFGAGLLVLSVAAMAAVGLVSRALTGPAFAATPSALQKELMGAEALEETPLTGVPPPEPMSAQKLASLATFTELLIGFLFALGLGVSGMVRPSKVAAFLSILGGTFDPSLVLVMGGALLVSLPLFQAMLRFKKLPQPLCSACYELPTKAQVDLPLVLGAALFGVGWGVGGICPGPGLVSVASLQPQLMLFVACMLVGMWLEAPLSAALWPKGSR